MKKALVISVLIILNIKLIQAYDPIYKGCEVKESDFTSEVLVDSKNDPDISKPTQVVLDSVILKDGTVGSDVYYITIQGKVNRLKAEQNNVELIGDINVKNGSDHGLVGVELDPNFKENGWMWFRYSPPADPAIGEFNFGNKLRLSRITLKGDKLDMTTEKIIWEGKVNAYKYDANRYPQIERKNFNIIHQGGGLAFDGVGNILFNIGNNSVDRNFGWEQSQLDGTDTIFSDVGGSGNTASPRGKILRIKPINFPDSENRAVGLGSTYEVPANNFGDYYSKYWLDKGEVALSQQYADHSVVLPEIYISGIRSIFSMNADPYYHWVSWGEVSSGVDEFHIVKRPIYSGYPYFGGWKKDGLIDVMSGATHGKDPDRVEDNSPINSGVKVYPPMGRPTIPYSHKELEYKSARTALGGQIYHYNGQLNSKSMFPPHYNQMWVIVDRPSRNKWAIDLDTSGVELKHVDGVRILTNHLNNDPLLDFEWGPDNAFYGVVYEGRVVKVSYNQACKDPNLLPPDVQPLNASPFPNVQNKELKIKGHLGYVKSSGNFLLHVHNTQGKLIWKTQGKGKMEFNLKQAIQKSGLFYVTLKSENSRNLTESRMVFLK